MRVSRNFLGILGAASFLLATTACQTDQPGVKDTMGSYSAMVDSTPDKVTAAAKSAVQDMQLTNVNSTATAIDGKVTAETAQGQDVTIDVAQAGDNISKVTVRVGATGDDAVSQQIIDKIKKDL
jgi:hypothetical protein